MNFIVWPGYQLPHRPVHGETVLLHGRKDDLLIVLASRTRVLQGEPVLLHGSEDDLLVVTARRARVLQGEAVLLHSGTHGPLSLDPTRDSGSPTFPIRYAGAPGADAIISAGATIPKAAWKPATGMAAGVLMADLKSLGLTDYGSLPHSGGRIDSCDQLASQKMQLFHHSKAQACAKVQAHDDEDSKSRALRHHPRH